MDDKGQVLESCRLCPRKCGVDRRAGGSGFCGLGSEIVISHFGPHFGEEPPITGTRGSGNIFFASCNLRCVYCQNFQISHGIEGKSVRPDGLVEIFFELEQRGCHNINLVSPTPYIPMLAQAMAEAKAAGLAIPFVYNTHAYENVEALRLLDGLVDIYLPDFKYWRSGVAALLSGATDYPETARASILEMKRQVGDLTIEDGLARKGFLVRHLVLPGNIAGSRQILEWIRDHLGRQTHLSLMSQYYPLYGASGFKAINRRIRPGEYDALTGFLVEEGFENVFIQELESAPLFVPDFDLAEPFGRA